MARSLGNIPDSKFTGPTWVPSDADRTQVGPMLTPWTLLSGMEHPYISLYHFMVDLNEIVRQLYISIYQRNIVIQFSTHCREIARWSLFQAYLNATVKFLIYTDILIYPYGYRIFLTWTATVITWEPCTNSRPYIPPMVYNPRMDNK